MRIILIILSTIIVLSLITCSENNNQPRDPLGSPTDTLITFVNAHNNFKDSQALKDLDSTLTDDMIFYFDPHDVGKMTSKGYLIPDSWSRDEFLDACQNMFNNAYSINLDIPQLETGLKGQYNSNGDEFFCETDINFLLYVDQTHGYQAVGPVDWKFKKGADNKWRISEIHDKTSPYILSIAGTSYGVILALFND